MGNTLSSTTESGSESFAGIPPLQLPAFETSTEKRDRALKHMLKANHHTYSTMHFRMIRHNHLPHSIASAYFLGASAEALHEIYDEEIKVLEPWEDSPSEVAQHDWRDFLGDRRYQRAYVDFFEDEMVRFNYDWKKVVLEYTLQGPEPLINAAVCGLGHPLIHLGYAFELDSREVGMEALAMFATNYDPVHNILDADFPTTAASPRPTGTPVHVPDNASTSPLELLSRLRAEPRLDGAFDTWGISNLGKLFKEKSDVVRDYYHQLSIEDPVTTHRHLHKLSALLTCATHPKGKPEYDFFVVHLLTFSHAVRTLLPLLPENYVQPLLKSHWLIIVMVYSIQLRPEIREEEIEGYSLGGKGWKEVIAKTLERTGGGDGERVHYLKAVRALRDSAELWKDEADFYLKAAAKIAWEFEDWVGFSPLDLE
ncbi:hypothetical protein RUND412_010605 [Rhizina undulata]